MKSMKGYLALLVLVLAMLPASASHLVGGEFEMKAKPNGSYDIIMNMYFDVVSGNPGAEENSIVVATFNKQTNQIVESFQLFRVSSEPVQYTNPACQEGTLQTKLIRYQTNRVLSPALYNNQAGYYLVWERCCRNDNIVNIRNGRDAGMVYYLEFPPVSRNGNQFVNSSPTLGAIPADYLCVGEQFIFDINATDPDGDSLAYRLTTPLNGFTTASNPVVNQFSPAPYPVITWENGYGLTNSIQGNPPLTVNARTGRLSVVPRFAGLHVFSVTVDEFRNGIKIGEVRREQQVKILNCPTNAKPTLSLLKPDGTLYQTGDTLVVTDATDYCFEVSVTDPNAGQTVTLEARPINFSAVPTLSVTSVIITQAGSVTKSKLCWPDCAINSPTFIYLVDLIAKDNACSAVKTDTLRLQFRVIPKPNAIPTLTTNLPGNTATVTVGDQLQFNLFGTDPDNDEIDLTLTGTDFDPTAVGMALSPVAGTGTIVSTFTWSPTCTDFLRKEYELNFVLKDRSCFARHTDTVQVKLLVNQIDSKADAFLPANIFTPNQDSLNDYFSMPTLPKDNCDDQFQEFAVYNRWGNKIYQTNNRNFTWNGANTADGVYYYLIKFRHRNYKGTVTIVR